MTHKAPAKVTMTWEGFAGAGALFMLITVALSTYSIGVPEYHLSVFAVGSLMLTTGIFVELFYWKFGGKP